MKLKSLKEIPTNRVPIYYAKAVGKIVTKKKTKKGFHYDKEEFADEYVCKGVTEDDLKKSIEKKILKNIKSKSRIDIEFQKFKVLHFMSFGVCE